MHLSYKKILLCQKKGERTPPSKSGPGIGNPFHENTHSRHKNLTTSLRRIPLPDMCVCVRVCACVCVRISVGLYNPMHVLTQ